MEMMKERGGEGEREKEREGEGTYLGWLRKVLMISVPSDWEMNIGMGMSILLGSVSLALCFYADSSRSSITWAYAIQEKRDSKVAEIKCMYELHGKLPLVYSIVALFANIITLTLGHIAYPWNFLSSANNSVYNVLWLRKSFGTAFSHGWKIALMFTLPWACFLVAAVLLLMGIAVELDHFNNWQSYHLRCIVVRQGMFMVAGLFSLAFTVLSIGVPFAARKILGDSEETEETEKTETKKVKNEEKFLNTKPITYHRNGETRLMMKHSANPKAFSNSISPLPIKSEYQGSVKSM